jgi:hypothetical protein
MTRKKAKVEPPPTVLCSKPECYMKVFARGLCWTHHAEEWRKKQRKEKNEVELALQLCAPIEAKEEPVTTA